MESLEAEECVLGAMLLSQEAAKSILAFLKATDFWKPAHGAAFDAIASCVARGVRPDAVTVMAEAEALGTARDAEGRGLVDGSMLVHLMVTTPSTANAMHYSRIVAEAALKRRIVQIGNDMMHQGRDVVTDALVLADHFKAEITNLDTPLVVNTDAEPVSSLLARPTQHGSWLIPGLLRQQWRVVVVAEEGLGKTTMLRQIGVCAALGIHPFIPSQDMPPRRVMILDLENPEDHVKEDMGHLVQQAKLVREAFDAEKLWIWRRPQGLDLRTRAGRAEMTAALQNARPELVMLGPLYKASVKGQAEGYEEVAEGIQTALDDFRVRHNFGLVIEAHAPGGQQGQRDWRPFGSSRWLYWPEVGLTLRYKANDRDTVVVGRFRGDRHRSACRWPDELRHGMVWPWQGIYEEGY